MNEQKAPAENPVPQAGGDKDIEENKAIAVLSYIGILCLVPLLAKKESRFAQFHAKQGLVLFIVEVVVYIISIIPIIGWLIGIIGTLIFIVISVIGIIKVLNGEYWEMPLIADLAKKINL